MQHLTTTRQIDHNDECVGCGAHVADPCHPTCPFETGGFGPAVVLRAAACRLWDHSADNLVSSIYASACALTEPCGDAIDLLVQTCSALVRYFEREYGDQSVQQQHDLFTGGGRFAHIDQVAMTLYAAAAGHDGCDFDPEEVGTVCG